MITIVVAVLIFILLWWLISLIPLPATAPTFAKPVFYILLILAAIFWLVRFSGIRLG